MTELKLIDVANSKTNLQTYIDRTEKRLSIIKAIIESLKQFEGKEITKRIPNALMKQFPDFKISVGRQYSWYELEIYEAGHYSKNDGSFDKISMNLGYSSQLSTIQVQTIIEHNQCYLLDESRLIGYKAELATIEEKCNNYNKALIAFKEAEKALDNVKFTVTQNDTLYIRDSRGISI